MIEEFGVVSVVFSSSVVDSGSPSGFVSGFLPGHALVEFWNGFGEDFGVGLVSSRAREFLSEEDAISPSFHEHKMGGRLYRHRPHFSPSWTSQDASANKFLTRL